MRRRIVSDRGFAAVASLAAVAWPAVPLAAQEPYAAPAAVRTLTGASGLTGLYTAVERDIRAARTAAARTGDTARAATLDGFLAGGRRFLAFDARGRGRAVEVNGDLVRADRIAVVVPGADGRLDNFDSAKWAGGGARSLHRRAAATAPGTNLAVIGWLGYDSPSTRDAAVLTGGRAADAARELTRLVDGLRRVNPRAGVALLCHSYGSVVCAEAGPGLGRSRVERVDHVALYGSPGVAVRPTSALKAAARVWTARSGGDWTRFVPKVRLFGLGFGPDPAALGAARFDAGDGPHSAYLRPGSTSLRNLTLIALGRDSEVTHARNV